MPKRTPRPKDAVYPQWLIDEAYDREMHPADLAAELEEVEQANQRMAVIDAKKLADMQAGRDEIAETEVEYP